MEKEAETKRVQDLIDEIDEAIEEKRQEQGPSTQKFPPSSEVGFAILLRELREELKALELRIKELENKI